MNAYELWDVFRQQHPALPKKCHSWSFDREAETLLSLVLQGKKRANCSAYDFYLQQKKELPTPGYTILCTPQGEAACILHIDKVTLHKFSDISPSFAFKEGEGDFSLNYWRKVRGSFFTRKFSEAGWHFTPDKILVCEEFHVVYIPSKK